MYEAICGPQLNTNPFNSAACYITALRPKLCGPVTQLGDVTQQSTAELVTGVNMLFGVLKSYLLSISDTKFIGIIQLYLIPLVER